MENNIIMLEDEHGCMIEFETIDVFEFEGVTYFALLEVLPEAELVMVEDEARLEAAFNEFLRRDEEMANEE